MGICFEDFRRMPLSVWRANRDAFAEAQAQAVVHLAWRTSWQLRSAGARDVDAEAMMGDLRYFEASFGKSKRRVLTDEEKFEKLWGRTEKKRAAGKLKE